MCHDRQQWRAHVFLLRLEDIGRVASENELFAYVRDDEKLLYLFPSAVAPPPATRTDMRLRKADGRWVVDGSLGTIEDLAIHEVEELNSRTPFDPSLLDVLRNSTVVMIGVGTVGSSISLSLARAGVGSAILADPDILSIANVLRYEGDLLDVGRPKVNVIRDRIRRINPWIQVEAYAEDIFEWPDDRLEGLLTRADLLVCSTDKNSVELTANDLAHRFSVPALFAGCYEEARNGEVFWWLPNRKIPCYCCLRGSLQSWGRRGTIDYSRASGPEDYEGEPGLHAAVDQVSNIAAQLALAILFRDEAQSELGKLITDDRQFVLVGSALAEIVERGGGKVGSWWPFDTHFVRFASRRSGCFCCEQYSEER